MDNDGTAVGMHPGQVGSSCSGSSSSDDEAQDEGEGMEVDGSPAQPKGPIVDEDGFQLVQSRRRR